MLAKGEPRELAKDRTLFRQDDPADALILVESGRLKLTQVTATGQAVMVRVTGPGELCAAIAVLDGKAYPFSAVASEPTRVRRWTAPVLRDLFRRHPRLESNILEVVGAHSREMLDKFRELATEPAPHRVARALLRLAPSGRRTAEGVWIEGTTQQDLAELTASTLYTVNHILGEWEADGILERGRGKLLLRAPARLAAIAGEGD